MKRLKGVLLVNLGTPDSTSDYDVRKYLREFLMDKRVIDVPFGLRWFLVNMIIAPFRAPQSAKIYRELWEERGSPLKFYGEDVQEMLQKRLGKTHKVALGMRYQSPSIEGALASLKEAKVTEILVIPLFPQYASASSGSVIDKVMELVGNWDRIPDISFKSYFFDHPGFIDSFVANAKPMLEETAYDHVVFSYHGIPERHVRKGSVGNYCQLNAKCCSTFNTNNQHCYRAQCFGTSRKIAAGLSIPEEKYSVSFQSRLGKDPWVKPYTDILIQDLPKEGNKKVLAFSPSFIADCLETTIEVGDEFKEIFEEAGGEHWELVPSLNNNEIWIDALEDMVHNSDK